MLQRVLVLQDATFMLEPMNTVLEAKAGSTVFIAGGWYADKMERWGFVRILRENEIIPDGMDLEELDEEDIPEPSLSSTSSETPAPRPRGRPRKNP